MRAPAQAEPAGGVAEGGARRIASFAAGLRYADVPPEVLEHAKVALLHDLTVALAGRPLAEPATALALALGAGSTGWRARLLGDGTTVDVRSATAANATLMTARAQDDVHLEAFSHVGCLVVPAVLALGEHLDADGREVLTALVVGYEATVALGDPFAARSAARGFRPVLYAQLGTAVACGRLLRSSARTIVHAIGLATGFGAGTSETWHAGTDEWLHQAGTASQNGLVAALLADRGATGAADALDGAAGLYATFGGSTAGTEAVGAELGRRWRIDGVTFKPYPVCTLNQVPVRVLTDLVSEHGLRPEDVERVVVTMPGAEARYPGTDSTAPFHGPGGAMMSVRFCLAVALREGTVATGHLLAHDDPELTALAGRVDVVADDDLPPRSCRIGVDRRDGTTLEGAFTSTRTTFGWGRDGALALAHELWPQTGLPPTALDALVEAVLDLEHGGARSLVDRCVVPTSSDPDPDPRGTP